MVIWVSPERQRCIRKVKFWNERRAYAALARMRVIHADTEWLRVYRCGSCRRWHLGNLTPPDIPPSGGIRAGGVSTYHQPRLRGV